MKHPKLVRCTAVVSVLIFLLTALSGGILELRRRSLADLEDQTAAERWGGNSCSQLSCFFAEGSGYETDRILSLERAVDTALTEASLKAEDGARLWYHAYSAQSELYASTSHGSAKIAFTAFGGNYFYIHPPKLIAGSPLSPGGENAGYIFLDQNAAWQLFGATDVTGMSVTIGDSEYTVCGVCAVPDGTVYDEAYGEEPRAWILLQSPAAQNIRQISSYEIVLPNPIDGFAADLLAKIIPEDDSVVTVENSERFSASALFEHLKTRSTLGTRLSPVTFPWWENIARVTEYRCASLLLLETVLLSIAALTVLLWIVLLWNPTGRAIKKGLLAAFSAIEEKYNALTRPKKYRDS